MADFGFNEEYSPFRVWFTNVCVCVCVKVFFVLAVIDTMHNFALFFSHVVIYQLRFTLVASLCVHFRMDHVPQETLS